MTSLQPLTRSLLQSNNISTTRANVVYDQSLGFEFWWTPDFCAKLSYILIYIVEQEASADKILCTRANSACLTIASEAPLALQLVSWTYVMWAAKRKGWTPKVSHGWCKYRRGQSPKVSRPTYGSRSHNPQRICSGFLYKSVDARMKLLWLFSWPGLLSFDVHLSVRGFKLWTSFL